MAFLKEKIKFIDIIDIVKKVLKMHKVIKRPSLEDILALDTWAKNQTKDIICKRNR